MKAALSQPHLSTQPAPQTLNFLSLTTHFFPAETNVHPEPWSSEAEVTLTPRAITQAGLSAFHTLSLFLPRAWKKIVINPS